MGSVSKNSQEKTSGESEVQITFRLQTSLHNVNIIDNKTEKQISSMGDQQKTDQHQWRQTQGPEELDQAQHC